MRKFLILCAAVACFSLSAGASTISVSPSDSLSLEQKLIARTAFDELKVLSKAERKERFRKARKEIRAFRAARKAGSDADVNTLILVVLAILLPPLAVYLHEQETNTKFWVTLLLFLLGIAGAVFFSWLLIFAAVVYALLVVLGAA